ncbi:MAG: FixH family protein [Anaerolineales bacterium]
MNKQLTVIATTVVTTLIVIIVFILLMPAIGPRFIHPMMMGSESAPAGLDTATSRATDSGLFNVSWRSDSDNVPLNQIHTWTLTVTTPDGTPVENAEIMVDGGMPQHGHGLPTNPQVTEYLGNGEYRVEGLRFQMTGWWEVKFNISTGGQTDSITFNLTLK